MDLKPTDRDISLLNWLWHVRYSTPRQIQRFIFNGTARCTVTNRLQALQEAGLVKITPKQIYCLGEADRKVVTITRGGISVLNQSLPDGAIRPNDVPRTDPGSLSKGCIIHDLHLVEIGIRLHETLDCAGWTSEHALRVLHRKDRGRETRTPDGIIKFKADGKVYSLVLEYVRIPYSQKMFVRAIELLRRQYPEALLMFVVDDLSHVANMVQWAAPFERLERYRGMLVFGLYSRVVEDGVDANWCSGGRAIIEDHILRLGSLVKGGGGAQDGDEARPLPA